MPRSILVIDDNPLVRDVVTRILELRGYTVFAAEDGMKGLKLFAEHPADAALVDVDMPLMNGVDVCRALRDRAGKLGRTITVWLMTGVVRPELLSSATAAGALGVIGKPFTTAELVAQLEGAMVGGSKRSAA